MSDTQELVQLGSSNVPATVNHQGVSTGLDDIRIKPSNLILVQNTTREPQGARPGQFLDVLTGEVFDEVEVVPLRVGKTRAMFPPGELDLDAKPICRSSDAIVPSPFVETPQAMSCARCPMSVWKKTNGKSVKPPCALKAKLLVIKKDTGMPKFITVGGKSIAALNPRLEAIKQDVKMNALKGLTLDLYDYFFTISADEVKSKTGKYYVMRFDKLSRVKNPAEFGPLFEEYVVNARYQAEGDEDFAENDQAADNAVSQVVAPEVVEAA